MTTSKAPLYFEEPCPRCGFIFRVMTAAGPNTLIGDCEFCDATLAHIVKQDLNDGFRLSTEIIDLPPDEFSGLPPSVPDPADSACPFCIAPFEKRDSNGDAVFQCGLIMDQKHDAIVEPCREAD